VPKKVLNLALAIIVDNARRLLSLFKAFVKR